MRKVPRVGLDAAGGARDTGSEAERMRLALGDPSGCCGAKSASRYCSTDVPAWRGGLIGRGGLR